MLVGADDGGVDLDEAVDLAGRVRVGLDGLQGWGEHARALETIPLMTCRSPYEAEPVTARGINAASNNHS
ncbi:hypothetical protein GCM10011578_050510 [Streptomyces fuscichromogenes]|uniref:Uncharacterized protein n=1 Tax=Streptomyces fuscichromogenes TaxID=1324013 RepID=A0A918CST2_9ACTN|nr:hypothetical protein GCM10011578_050510 [Streptomyces fuscichromogenes]